MLRHAWLNLWQKHIILAESTRYFARIEQVFQISLFFTKEKLDKLLIELYFLQDICKKEEIVCIKRTIHNIPFIDFVFHPFLFDRYAINLQIHFCLYRYFQYYISKYPLKWYFFISISEMIEIFISFFSLLIKSLYVTFHRSCVSITDFLVNIHQKSQTWF